MIWLIVFNWFQLLLAFVLGLAAARWIMGRPGGVGREDLFAELAAERTKRHEAEADRARERARAAEFERKLQDVKREIRLGVHEPAAAANGAGAATPTPTDAPRPRARVSASPTAPASETASGAPDADAPPADAPPATDALSVEAAPAATPSSAEASAATPGEAGSSMGLTAIDGVTPERAERLRAEGVTIADIAQWSPDDVAKYDVMLETGGGVAAQDWVGQAQTLLNAAAAAGEPARKGAAG